MSNNLTNAYALHAELTEIQKSLADEKATLRANKYAQQFFTVTTWIIYLLFAAAMYAAPLWVNLNKRHQSSIGFCANP